MKTTDQIGRTLEIKEPLKRIISLVPSQTELLVSLDLEDKIVGITKFCVHPENLLNNKTIVGGTKSIHWDRVKALNPDIILCNKEENTKDIVTEAEKICLVHVSDIISLDDNYEMMRQYGAIFNIKKRVEKLSKEIALSLEELESQFQLKTQKSVAYIIWRKPYMVAGGDTFISSLLKLAGFKNFYEDEKRYPEKSLKDLETDAQKIDYIFLSSEPFPFKEKHFKDFENFIDVKKLVLVDGEYFSWYGSRLKMAFNYFGELQKRLT